MSGLPKWARQSAPEAEWTWRRHVCDCQVPPLTIFWETSQFWSLQIEIVCSIPLFLCKMKSIKMWLALIRVSNQKEKVKYPFLSQFPIRPYVFPTTFVKYIMKIISRIKILIQAFPSMRSCCPFFTWAHL